MLIIGGALGGILGAAGFMICVGISKRQLPIIVKLIISIVAVGLVWLIYLVIAVMITGG